MFIIGKEIDSLAYDVLFLFSFLLTELNVTLSSLSPDNDVMSGSNSIHDKQRWDQICFHSRWYSKIRKEKRNKKNNAREINVSQPRQPLFSAALIPYMLINLTFPFFVCCIKTGKHFLNQFRKKLATKDGNR